MGKHYICVQEYMTLFSCDITNQSQREETQRACIIQLKAHE